MREAGLLRRKMERRYREGTVTHLADLLADASLVSRGDGEEGRDVERAVEGKEGGGGEGMVDIGGEEEMKAGQEGEKQKGE